MARWRVATHAALVLTIGRVRMLSSMGAARFVREGLKDRLRLVKAVVCVVVFAAALWGLHWGAGAGFLLGLGVGSVSGLIDGRISVAAALLCLLCCPILLFAEQNAWLQQSTLIAYYAAGMGLLDLHGAADQVAVWAYYLLCIGVVAMIVQQSRRGRRRDGDRATD